MTTLAPRSFLQGHGLKLWTSPHASPTLVLLSSGTLCTCDVAPDNLGNVVDGLSAGVALDAALPNEFHEIPLTTVARIDADLRRGTFRVSHESGRRRVWETFRLSQRRDSEELFAVLRHQLSARFLVRKRRIDMMRDVAVTLILLLFFALAGFLSWQIRPAAGANDVASVQSWPGNLIAVAFWAILILIGIFLFGWLVLRSVRRRDLFRLERARK